MRQLDLSLKQDIDFVSSIHRAQKCLFGKYLRSVRFRAYGQDRVIQLDFKGPKKSLYVCDGKCEEKFYSLVAKQVVEFPEDSLNSPSIQLSLVGGN